MERGEREIKKIRLTIPYFMQERILEDVKHFNLKTGEIGNRIFNYYSNRDIKKIDISADKGEVIQFNLNKNNSELFDTVIKEHMVDNEANFFRNLFLEYLDNPRYLREKILYFDIFEKIENAIKENRKINIKYRGEVRTISPYLIKTSSEENRSYIFSYCEKNEAHRNYRISNIESVSISKLTVDIKDKEYIESIDKNFDPFLSYNNRVKIRIDKEGEEIFKRVVENRPKLIEKDGDIWILEASEKLAKIYFSQFLSTVEILEPLELREWFKEELKRSLNNYL